MTSPVGYGADPRLRLTEWLPWLLALAAFFLLPDYLSLGARILTYILFALSLDLILGYAGIITLGHSAFFGIGAYVAGILAAQNGGRGPLSLLRAAGCAGGGVWAAPRGGVGIRGRFWAPLTPPARRGGGEHLVMWCRTGRSPPRPPPRPGACQVTSSSPTSTPWRAWKQ